MEQQIIELLKKWFANKAEKQIIKTNRNEFMETYQCMEFESTCIHMPLTHYLSYCEPCKTRHNYYLKLKALSHENSALMNKIRRRINKLTN